MDSMAADMRAMHPEAGWSARGRASGPCRSSGGFSLIELMIVVVIVGILASIAVPSYRDFVEDSRRADAKAALSELAGAMERYYSDNLTYASAADGNGVPNIFASQVPVDGGKAYYNLRVTSADADGFTLEATPVNAQSGDGSLRLRSTGQRSWDRNADGSYGSGESCWKDSCS